MVQRGISEAQRWQIIGMHTTGMSFKAIGRQMGYHYTIVSRLVRKHTQTNNERVRRCRSANSGHLMTLLDLNPADLNQQCERLAKIWQTTGNI
jgi:IS30 family transposase